MARPSFSHWANRLYTGEVSYDFVGRRRTWYAVAAVVMAVSLLALGVRGLNLGIEFEGGSQFQVSGVDSADLDEQVAREVVEDVAGAGTEARVSTVNDDAVLVRTAQLSQQQSNEVSQALAEAYDVPQSEITSSFVGPSWGEQISQRAALSLVVFLVLVSLAITLYFRTWKMAVAALVALLHDLVVTVGVYALVGFQVTPASVIGFLTILGYSLYDTVVVFDKVRENTADVLETRRMTFRQAANLAVNQTLVRSVNTSIVALLPVGSILAIGWAVLGEGVLLDLSLALFVGIAAGTYSSIFIATPLLVHLREREPAVKAQARRVAERTGDPAAGAADDVAPGSPVAVGAGSTLRESTGPGQARQLGAAGRRPLRDSSGGQRSQPRRNG